MKKQLFNLEDEIIKEPAKLVHSAQKKSKRLVGMLTTQQKEYLSGIVAGVIVTVFLVVGFVTVFSSARFLHNGPALDNDSETTAKRPLVASSPIAQPLLQIRVTNYYETSGNQLKAEPGFVFVVVNAEVTHHMKQAGWLAPALQSYLEDNKGQQYSLAAVDTITQPFVAQNYQPGQVATGQLGYQVPKTARGLKWCYRLDVDPQEPVCVGLNL